jgi:hypothetical protein
LWVLAGPCSYFDGLRAKLADFFRVSVVERDADGDKTDAIEQEPLLSVRATDAAVNRIPGVGIYYSEAVDGVPTALTELVRYRMIRMLPPHVGRCFGKALDAKWQRERHQRKL